MTFTFIADNNCSGDVPIDEAILLPKLISCTLSSVIKRAVQFFDTHDKRMLWIDMFDILPNDAMTPRRCFLCFQKFQMWIHSGKAPVRESTDKDAPTFIDLWLFGDLIGAPRFQNACLRSNATGSCITRKTLEEVFRRTFGRGRYHLHSQPLIPEALLLFCLHTSLSHSSATMQFPDILRAGGDLAVYAGSNPLSKLKHQYHDCLSSWGTVVYHEPSMDSLCCHAFELDDNVPKKYGGQLGDASLIVSNPIIRSTPNLPRFRPNFRRQLSQAPLVQTPGSSRDTIPRATPFKRQKVKEEKD